MARLETKEEADPTILNEYLQKMWRIKVDKLMTTAWNFKNIHLAIHPDHKNASWVIELEEAMKFANSMFPPEEKREWRK